MADIYEDNKYIKMAIVQAYSKHDLKDLQTVVKVLAKRMQEDGTAPTPVVDADKFNVTGEKSKEKRMVIDAMKDENGDFWFPLFTDEEEVKRRATTKTIVNLPIRAILESGLTSERVKGVVINPFGQYLALPKEVLKLLFVEKKDA